MSQPTLIIGHRADPIHPFSDSGMLEGELPNARMIEATSILEWRVSPERLDDELSDFLDDVWSGLAEVGWKPQGRRLRHLVKPESLDSRTVWRATEKRESACARSASRRSRARGSSERKRLIAGYFVAGLLGAGGARGARLRADRR